MYVSNPQKSQNYPVSLEELRNKTPLADRDLLHKVGWALGDESEDLHYTISYDGQCAVLE